MERFWKAHLTQEKPRTRVYFITGYFPIAEMTDTSWNTVLIQRTRWGWDWRVKNVETDWLPWTFNNCFRYRATLTSARLNDSPTRNVFRAGIVQSIVTNTILCQHYNMRLPNFMFSPFRRYWWLSFENWCTMWRNSLKANDDHCKIYFKWIDRISIISVVRSLYILQILHLTSFRLWKLSRNTTPGRERRLASWDGNRALVDLHKNASLNI